VDKIHVELATQGIIVFKAHQYKFHVQKELTVHLVKVNVQYVKLGITALYVQFNRLNVLQELIASLANLYVHFVLLVHSVLKDQQVQQNVMQALTAQLVYRNVLPVLKGFIAFIIQYHPQFVLEVSIVNLGKVPA